MNKELYSPLIFDLSRTGSAGVAMPDYNYGDKKFELPTSLRRESALELP